MSTPPPARRIIRPSADLYRSTRLRHIRCAYSYWVDGLTIRKIAARCRVGATTVHRWVHAALDYHDDEARGLIARLGGDPRLKGGAGTDADAAARSETP